MFYRWYEEIFRRDIKKPYVHLVFGARQTGKSTLIRNALPPQALKFDFSNPVVSPIREEEIALRVQRQRSKICSNKIELRQCRRTAIAGKARSPGAGDRGDYPVGCYFANTCGARNVIKNDEEYRPSSVAGDV